MHSSVVAFMIASFLIHFCILFFCFPFLAFACFVIVSIVLFAFNFAFRKFLSAASSVCLASQTLQLAICNLQFAIWNLPRGAIIILLQLKVLTLTRLRSYYTCISLPTKSLNFIGIGAKQTNKQTKTQKNREKYIKKKQKELAQNLRSAIFERKLFGQTS